MDLIDREELLDALHNRLCHPKTPEQSPRNGRGRKAGKKQPAIQPKRGERIEPTVEWVDNFKFVLAKCTACGNRAVMDMEQLNDTIKFARNFCPNCGADMRACKHTVLDDATLLVIDANKREEEEYEQ